MNVLNWIANVYVFQRNFNMEKCIWYAYYVKINNVLNDQNKYSSYNI